MPPHIYVETSVISYLTARPSRNILTLARQELTSSWWARRDQGFEPFVSPLVLAEIGRGDANAAAMRLALCSGLPRLDVNADAESLAKRLLVDGAIPRTEPEDALHVAIAVVHQLNYIATWNFVHRVGASAKFKLQMHISRMGYTPPIIATPEELLEELS